jgi:predicted RNA-binding protein with EMAP domain
VKAKMWVEMARGEIRSAVRILKMVTVRMLLGGYMSLSEHSNADAMYVWP